MKYVIIAAVFYVIYYLWKNRKIKNSHKIPQVIELTEFYNDENNPKFDGIHKGQKLILSRELGDNAYSLYVTIETNGKNLDDLKKIIFSWSEWSSRMFNFNYYPTDEGVEIKKNSIKIDIGSFNNCTGSKNFLERTSKSNVLTVELLNFLPEFDDYEYEKNISYQTKFMAMLSKEDLNKFKKGLHYLDS